MAIWPISCICNLDSMQYRKTLPFTLAWFSRHRRCCPAAARNFSPPVSLPLIGSGSPPSPAQFISGDMLLAARCIRFRSSLFCRPSSSSFPSSSSPYLHRRDADTLLSAHCGAALTSSALHLHRRLRWCGCPLLPVEATLLPVRSF
jgi:hypothetical protein